MSSAEPPQPVPASQAGTGNPAREPVSPRLSPGAHADLLSRIWQQSLPLMRERVAALDRAAHLAGSSSLSAAARTDAADLAHKLAGSLGMFGFPQGTEIAREMEHILEAEALSDTPRLLELASQLRAVLPL